VTARDPNDPCLFCAPRDVTGRNELAWCTRDTYPVSPGHSLIIPFRHVSDFFDLSPEEMAACFDLLRSVRKGIDAELSPAGYNVGVNVGRAGGQSIMHVHVHLIPRYTGDHPTPGGIRYIIPGKASYPRGAPPADG
jgi:diadenosine tetraphosphate (Ap4A) HIT family hydrolase